MARFRPATASAGDFTLSTAPDFVAKVRDVVGLYVTPPERAIVLCVDEKPHIQARTASSPCCPCELARRRVVVTTTISTVSPRCLPSSTSQPAGHRQVLWAPSHRRVSQVSR